jgi:hypothetical protein
MALNKLEIPVGSRQLNSHAAKRKVSKFLLSVSWTECGEMEVEASTRKEAERLAIKELPLPTSGDYLQDSFRIDKIVKQR